jgi:hypothetical protein
MAQRPERSGDGDPSASRQGPRRSDLTRQRVTPGADGATPVPAPGDVGVPGPAVPGIVVGAPGEAGRPVRGSIADGDGAIVVEGAATPGLADGKPVPAGDVGLGSGTLGPGGITPGIVCVDVVPGVVPGKVDPVPSPGVTPGTVPGDVPGSDVPGTVVDPPVPGPVEPGLTPVLGVVPSVPGLGVPIGLVPIPPAPPIAFGPTAPPCANAVPAPSVLAAATTIIDRCKTFIESSSGHSDDPLRDVSGPRAARTVPVLECYAVRTTASSTIFA